MSEMTNNLFEDVPVPAPTVKEEAPVEDTTMPEITPDSILAEIISQDENGYSPCTIAAVLNELVNITGNESLDEIDEEHTNEVESDIIEYCKVDVYSLDGNLMNVVFTFDSPTDAYLKDMYDLLNRYKRMLSHYAEKNADIPEGEPVTVPMFSIQILPNVFRGKAAAMYSFPIAFFKTLDNNGREVNLHLLFDAENTVYSQVDISEDELSDITADVLREMQMKAELNQQ